MNFTKLEECPNIFKLMEDRLYEVLDFGEDHLIITEKEELNITRFLQELPTEDYMYIMMLLYLSDTGKK